MKLDLLDFSLIFEGPVFSDLVRVEFQLSRQLQEDIANELKNFYRNKINGKIVNFSLCAKDPAAWNILTPSCVP